MGHVPQRLDIVDIQRAVQDIWRVISFLDKGTNIDLHGRRFLNVGGAVGPNEYVTRGELIGATRAVDRYGELAALMTDVLPPSALVNLSVTGGDGQFVANWEMPVDGATTLDGIAEQYATDSGFTTGLVTLLWGPTTHLEGVDPNQAYYFRFCAHNRSQRNASTLSAGDIATLNALGPSTLNGWGPWVNAPLNPVSSGQLAGTGTDTVIPGALVNLTVWGSNGDFLASWEDPATGNNSIDDIAEEYSISNSPWTRVETKTLRWGNTRFLRGSCPNTTYHFRFAARNKSGEASHATGPGAVGGPFYGETGWGPWTYWNGSGSTTTMASSVAVSSGQIGFATAASGARMTMNSTEGIKGYDSSNNVLTQIGTDGKASLKSAASGARIEIDATNGIRVYDSSGNLWFQISLESGPYGYIRAAGLAMLDSLAQTLCLYGRKDVGSDISISTGWGTAGSSSTRIASELG